MERSLLRSLKEKRSHAKQERDTMEQERQPLLSDDNTFHMAQPLDSGHQIDVVVETGNGNDRGKETENVSKSTSESPRIKPPGSFGKSKLSFEDVLTEAVTKRNKDSPGNEISQPSSSSGVPELLGSSSNCFPRGKSWRLLIDRTKSRLIDPPEEQYQTSERMVNSEGAFRNVDILREEDDIEDIPEEYKRMKFNTLTILQWVSLVLIIGVLICNLSITVIRKQTLWDLPLWKWEVMLLALLCGRLVSGWGIRLVVIVIERNFLWRKRVLYFVYGLRNAVQNCLWLGLVLFVWHCIFDDKVKQETNSKVLPYVTKVLICFLVATLIWLLKTLLVKVLASSFHVSTFFDRIHEALFNQYVIETLSGPPLFERNNTQEEEKPIADIQEFQNAVGTKAGDLRTTPLQRSGSGKLQRCSTVGKKPRFSKTMAKKEDHEIPIDHLHQLNQKNISAWNMKRMINIVRHGALSTLGEQILNSDIEDDSLKEIKTECQAKKAADKIFEKVAKTGSEFIYLEDLMCFMVKEEASKTMSLLKAASENKGISKSSLNSWLINAFRERKALSLSLNDTKTAVDELHNMLSIVVAIIIVIIWLVILGIPITQFLVFISSQVLLVAFIFGNTCKTVFEAIIFLFIMHPYDVGDRCEVDGVQMTVDEMNILTTVFLRYDNQKIRYPNSVLATKPIGNFYRSPHMYETIEFSVHISTPMEKITKLKESIIGYTESKRDHWYPSPSMAVTDVEDMNNVKMSMRLQHRLNFQNPGERIARRALLIEEMIKVFKQLNVEYRMLPLDVNVRNFSTLTSNRLPSNWTASANATDNFSDAAT